VRRGQCTGATEQTQDRAKLADVDYQVYLPPVEPTRQRATVEPTPARDNSPYQRHQQLPNKPWTTIPSNYIFFNYIFFNYTFLTTRFIKQHVL
jgi:hypothetical protein